MTKDEADSLRDRRKEEQPQFEWVVQRRAADDWAVLRLPGNADRASRAWRDRRRCAHRRSRRLRGWHGDLTMRDVRCEHPLRQVRPADQQLTQ